MCLTSCFFLERIVDERTHWGWKIEWGYQPWQLKTYHQQKALTLQAGWEDRVDFGLHLHQDIQYKPSKIPILAHPHRTLAPIDLDALEVRETEEQVETDVCRVCHIQHERLVAFHEVIPEDIDSISTTENGETVFKPQ